MIKVDLLGFVRARDGMRDLRRRDRWREVGILSSVTAEGDSRYGRAISAHQWGRRRPEGERKVRKVKPYPFILIYSHPLDACQGARTNVRGLFPLSCPWNISYLLPCTYATWALWFIWPHTLLLIQWKWVLLIPGTFTAPLGLFKHGFCALYNSNPPVSSLCNTPI